jgi:hypothetical protein
MIHMVFQNIVKRKEKFLEPTYGGAGLGTTSPNGGCSVGAPHTTMPTSLSVPI